MRRRKRSGTPSGASSTSKQPELLTFFLDESLDSDSVVAALQEAGAAVERSRHHFDRGTADEIWLAYAGSKQWIVLTRDQRIRYRRLERLALQQAGVRAFVFTGGNVTIRDTGAILAGALKRMEKISRSNAAPFIYHIGRSGKPIRMKS